MKTLLYNWAKANSVMVVNAGSLIGTTAVTSVLGFAYWWLAARVFSPETVGFASAAISAMMLLGTVCILGLGTLLIGELPRQPGKEASLISAALIMTGGVGGGIGVLFAYAAPFVSPNLRVLGASIQDVTLFAIGVSLTAITLVLDQALIGLFRGELQLWRNTLFAVSKLATLLAASLWLSHAVGLTIYATWIAGNVLSLAALVGFVVLKKGWSIKNYLPRWELLWKLGGTAIRHHILNLILQVPALAFPVLVTIMLSVIVNAWFYVSWTISNFVSVVPFALATVLYAANSAQPVTLAHKTRMTLVLSLVTCVLANCLLQFGSKQILGFFSQAYAEQASWSLRILSLGAFPLIIKNHYVALCRIRDRMGQATLPLAVSALLELGLAALGARLGGLSGLSLGWLTAVSIESVFMFHPLYKVVRAKDTSASVELATRTAMKKAI